MTPITRAARSKRRPTSAGRCCAGELLDAIERRGTGTADLIADYAAPLPVTVIAELLGVEHSDRRKFHRWSNQGQIAIRMLLERFSAIELKAQAGLVWRRGLVLSGVDSLPVRYDADARWRRS